MDAEPAWHPLLDESYIEMNPAISPDGRWLAYFSEETGPASGELYVLPFPEVESGKRQVSEGGGLNPMWSLDGSELFYRAGGVMWAVPVQTEPSFSAGVAVPLFEDVYDVSTGTGRNYDVALDGRFLMVKPDASSGVGGRQINIVRNWSEELKARVPAGQ